MLEQIHTFPREEEPPCKHSPQITLPKSIGAGQLVLFT